jgi:hypothetical protein
MEQLIKSRARVKATGEVFTPIHIVNKMLDLIPAEMYANPLSTWMEPACGTGNFLVEILKRKLSYGAGQTHALKCVSSLYGVDIAMDNIHECRAALERLVGLAVDDDPAFLSQVNDILHHNIVRGDTLNHPELVPIWEYHWQGDTFARSAHTLASIAAQQ